VAAALLLAGCGSGGEDLARQAAEAFESALASNDPATACALVVEDADCTSPNLPHGTVREVRVWGDAAQARTDDDTLFLRETATGWRISGAGCRPNGERPYRCEVGGR
jgi:hypothetical protein